MAGRTTDEPDGGEGAGRGAGGDGAAGDGGGDAAGTGDPAGGDPAGDGSGRIDPDCRIRRAGVRSAGPAAHHVDRDHRPGAIAYWQGARQDTKVFVVVAEWAAVRVSFVSMLKIGPYMFDWPL